MVQVANGEEAVLLPIRGAGEGGWCFTTIRDIFGCRTFRLPVFGGPIISETWNGNGSSAGERVLQGIVLTTSEVAAVSIEGRPPVPTRPNPTLPNNLRAAVIELRTGTLRPPPRSHFVAVNSMGTPIAEARTVGVPLEFRAPSQNWVRATEPPFGVCSLQPKKTVNAHFVSGAIMTSIVSHLNVRGREFVDCLHASYLMEGWPLEVNILLDAEHPGSRPAGLPTMGQLSGHRGVFAGPNVDEATVARRIPGAWLLVEKGRGFHNA